MWQVFTRILPTGLEGGQANPFVIHCKRDVFKVVVAVAYEYIKEQPAV